MSMENITVFKVPLWTNDYHCFCNSIRIYRLVWIRALTWTRHHRDIVIPGQTSTQPGDVADANYEKTSPSWVDWHHVALPKRKTKIAHTGAADVSFLKTLTTVPFSLHVGDLFLLHLHGTQVTSIPFQRFPLIGVKISCLAQQLKHLFHVLSLTNHVW